MRQNEIMAAMHEHSPDHACGENELQIPDFASYQWEWMAAGAGVPRPLPQPRPDAALPVHARRARSDHRRQFPSDRRWMLKSNQHSEQLGPLLATYPDATVVMIHRDPVATLQSLLTMRGLLVKSSQKVPTSTRTSTTGSTASSACCAATCATAHSFPTTSWSS